MRRFPSDYHTFSKTNMNDTMSHQATDPNGGSARVTSAFMDMMFGKIDVDQTDCKHVFEFVDCMGTFCVKCRIGYGVECLHPDCKVHHCDVHKLVFPVFSEETFADVAEQMNDDIYIINLGHDGVKSGDDEDVHTVLSYPGLKIVEYCGYYTDENVCEIFKDEKYEHITFREIW